MKYTIIAILCISLATLSFVFTDQGAGREAAAATPAAPSTVVWAAPVETESPVKKSAVRPPAPWPKNAVVIATPAPAPAPAPDPAVIWAEAQPVILLDVQGLWPRPHEFSRSRAGSAPLPRVQVIPTVPMARSDLNAADKQVPFILKFEEGWGAVTNVGGRYALEGYYETATKRVYLRKLDSKAYELIPDATARRPSGSSRWGGRQPEITAAAAALGAP